MKHFEKFDIAECLDNKDSQFYYINETARENDPYEFLQSIDTVARARGLKKVAKKAGMTPDEIHKFLRDPNSSFLTIFKIFNATGYTFAPMALTKKK